MQIQPSVLVIDGQSHQSENFAAKTTGLSDSTAAMVSNEYYLNPVSGYMQESDGRYGTITGLSSDFNKPLG